MCITPCLVSQAEMRKQVCETIENFLNNIANSSSYDRQEAERTYFVWVSILQHIDPKEALNYPVFEEALEDIINSLELKF
jgi:hypothetical protein